MIKKIKRRQPNSEHCFVCGRENELSMEADFFDLEDGTVAGLLTCAERHQSFPGVVHGGVVSALLDEIIGRAMMTEEYDSIGMTLELNVKFLKPVPYDVPLVLTGRVIEDGPKICVAAGDIILPDGEIAASATGKYYKLTREKLELMGATEMMMKYYPRENEPTEIEIPEKRGKNQSCLNID